MDLQPIWLQLLAKQTAKQSGLGNHKSSRWLGNFILNQCSLTSHAAVFCFLPHQHGREELTPICAAKLPTVLRTTASNKGSLVKCHLHRLKDLYQFNYLKMIIMCTLWACKMIILQDWISVVCFCTGVKLRFPSPTPCPLPHCLSAVLNCSDDITLSLVHCLAVLWPRFHTENKFMCSFSWRAPFCGQETEILGTQWKSALDLRNHWREAQQKS